MIYWAFLILLLFLFCGSPNFSSSGGGVIKKTLNRPPKGPPPPKMGK